ncbi:class I lanthipeptide [uncultured Kordia sp.]|uniref:class I lanthipeptide n=1 Tax=uncultured Kordia sp. TaxID=507699 RepID=UPI002610499A|nr:class I lanthipeptide [uncultured Kordia sp.]
MKKKRSLKKLSLNKKAISMLQPENIIYGGNEADEGSWLFWYCHTHPRICSGELTLGNACLNLTERPVCDGDTGLASPCQETVVDCA